MKNLNFSELDVETLDHFQAKKINGGRWGWVGVIAAEVVDVITSAGENLKEAYQNGYEAGKS